MLDAGPDRALGAILHDRDAPLDRTDTVSLNQSSQPQLGKLGSRDHRIRINPNPLGKPDIVPDEPQDVALLLTLLHHLHARDENPLGVDVVGIGKISAGKRRPGVLHMSARQSPEDKFILIKDRPEKTPIRRVARITLVRIVRQKDIPRINIVPIFVENVLHRKLRADKLDGQADRNRNGVSLAIPDPHRDVF